MNDTLDVHRAGAVLLATDSPSQVAGLRRELHCRGYAVVGAQQGSVPPGGWDAAIVWLSRPRDGGEAVVERLRRLSARVPVIWVAPMDPSVRDRARRLGVVLFYAPIEVDAVVDAIDRVTTTQ